MKSTERVDHQERSGEGGIHARTLPDEASLGIGPDAVDGDVWSALVRRARDCDADAYGELYLRLGDFRNYFARHLFADPEGAYGELVRELVDQIRYGFLLDPTALLAQARASAMRKTADRIRCLTTAARILSTLPKRHREVLIRSQLALGSSAHLGRVGDGARVRRSGATVA
jgi:hypothetical protein